MIRRLKAMVGIVVLMVATLVGVTLVSAAPATAASSCDVPAKEYSKYGTFTAANVNMRTGPSTSCAIIGVGQAGHSLRFDCWAFGTAVTRNGLTWTTWSHIWNDTLGTTGWSSDAYLSDNGATMQCMADGVSTK